MSDDARRDVESVFQDAMDLPPHKRAAYLGEVCAGDDALRREVESLLDHADRAGESFLAESAAEAADVKAGDTIGGRYRLCRVLGEGGLGVVWLAEQVEPLRREVALKIVKLGMDSKEVLGRFEAERNALNLMDFPGIAEVYDAGVTDRGRPFFVMELVRGVPITQFCDGERMTTRQRLELFGEVCEAVQHAHQKGVIHRDLKPSNLLVQLRDGKAAAKVIDFGIAKATAQKLTERTVFTMAGQLIGTPEYMSPEQAEMSAVGVDSTSDIYSLGVILYELLTGTLPFDSETLRRAGLSGIARALRETDPARPSTRLSTLGEAATSVVEQRRTDPRTLRRDLEGDLDWIVMRAMEKERTRRYASASELAADVARYLRDEPVLAGPPTARYRMGKFVRRNRAGVAWAGVLGLALCAGVTATVVQAVRATIAEQRVRTALERSERETLRARTTVDFLRWGLGFANRGFEDGDEPTLRETLDLASQSIGERFEGQKAAEADVRWMMGMVYVQIGAFPQAREQLLVAQELLGEQYLADPESNRSPLMETLVWLNICERELGNGEAAAAPWFREAVDICQELLTQKSAALGEAVAAMRAELITPEPPAPELIRHHLDRVSRAYEAALAPDDPAGVRLSLALLEVVTHIGNVHGNAQYAALDEGSPLLEYLRYANRLAVQSPVSAGARTAMVGHWMEARLSAADGGEEHRVAVARALMRDVERDSREYWITADSIGILGDALLQQGLAQDEEEIASGLIESHRLLWSLRSPDNTSHVLLEYRRAFGMWRLAGMGLAVDGQARHAVHLIDRSDVLDELERGIEQMQIPKVLGMITASMMSREGRSARWYEVGQRAGERAAELKAAQASPASG